MTDKLGKRIGVFNGGVINEIPNATILSTGEAEIYELPSELSYEVKIVGAETGTAEVNVISPVLGLQQIYHPDTV